MEKPKYSIKVPINQIKKLKDDPAFIVIMQICRYLNQLYFCINAYDDYKGNNTPEGTRQQHNAMYFWSGVLYEAVDINNILGKYFMSYKTYQEGFRKFSKTPNLEEFKQALLNRMRNGVAFHTFSDRIQETLQTLNLRRYNFLVSNGTKINKSYYQLADDIALNHIIGVHDSTEAEIKYLEETFLQLSKITVIFIENAENLIGEYIHRKRWKIEIDD